uniref:RING-type domain-containing protein n=1 Tax=Callorhinchus milii TaxID=7868 RepID=A0A4W3HGT9_CALMI
MRPGALGLKIGRIFIIIIIPGFDPAPEPAVETSQSASRDTLNGSKKQQFPPPSNSELPKLQTECETAEAEVNTDQDIGNFMKAVTCEREVLKERYQEVLDRHRQLENQLQIKIRCLQQQAEEEKNICQENGKQIQEVKTKLEELKKKSEREKKEYLQKEQEMKTAAIIILASVNANCCCDNNGFSLYCVVTMSTSGFPAPSRAQLTQQIKQIKMSRGSIADLSVDELMNLVAQRLNEAEQSPGSPRLCLMCQKVVRGNEVHPMSCSHIVHKECIKYWAQSNKNSACPFCPTLR